MTDNADVQNKETARSAALKKFALTLVILGVLWLILAYVLPFIARISGVPTSLRPGVAIETNPTQVIEQKNQQIATLNGRLDDLEAKLKTMEDVIAKSGNDASADAKIAALQTKLDNLAQQPASANTEDNERVTELEDKLGEQQQAITDMKAQLNDTQAKGTHALAEITVLGQIKDAAARGNGFADLLMQLKAMTQDNAQAQDLESQLTPVADNGAMTLPLLQNAFEAIVPVALSPGAQPGTFMGNLRSLIRIRRVGGQQLGGDDESVIARAEAKLNRGDVEGSVKELSQLSPPGATAFAGWSNQAEAYVRLHQVLDALQLALINPTPAATPPPSPAPQPSPVAAPVTAPAPSAKKPAPAELAVPEGPDESPAGSAAPDNGQ